MALHDSMGMLLHSRYCFPAYEGRHGRELLRPGECVKPGMCAPTWYCRCVLLHFHNTRPICAVRVAHSDGTRFMKWFPVLSIPPPPVCPKCAKPTVVSMPGLHGVEVSVLDLSGRHDNVFLPVHECPGCGVIGSYEAVQLNPGSDATRAAISALPGAIGTAYSIGASGKYFGATTEIVSTLIDTDLARLYSKLQRHGFSCELLCVAGRTRKH